MLPSHFFCHSFILCFLINLSLNRLLSPYLASSSAFSSREVRYPATTKYIIESIGTSLHYTAHQAVGIVTFTFCASGMNDVFAAVYRLLGVYTYTEKKFCLYCPYAVGNTSIFLFSLFSTKTTRLGLVFHFLTRRFSSQTMDPK